jgi:hypothetical protein
MISFNAVSCLPNWRTNYDPKRKKMKRMRTKLMKLVTLSSLFASALVSLVAVAMTFGTFGTARAQDEGNTCGVQTLRGLYLFATHGYNIVGGVALPKAIVEGVHFKGNGTLSSPFATVSINGNVIRSSGTSGVYTVNADCTGSLTFTPGPSFDIFVDASGERLWMIQTGPAVAPPAVFEGTATRVSR